MEYHPESLEESIQVADNLMQIQWCIPPMSSPKRQPEPYRNHASASPLPRKRDKNSDIKVQFDFLKDIKCLKCGGKGHNVIQCTSVFVNEVEHLSKIPESISSDVSDSIPSKIYDTADTAVETKDLDIQKDTITSHNKSSDKDAAVSLSASSDESNIDILKDCEKCESSSYDVSIMPNFAPNLFKCHVSKSRRTKTKSKKSYRKLSCDLKCRKCASNTFHF